MRMNTKVTKWKEEKSLQRLLAIEYVKDYCMQKGFSLEKLKAQRFELSYHECGFFQSSDTTALGLLNDQETMPKATLIIKNENGELVICETEYTKKYLGKESV